MKKHCMTCHVADCYLDDEQSIKDCPIHKFMSVVGKKWTMIILLVLEKPLRYGELKKTIPDITEKMLITTLHALEQVGYIENEKILGKKLSSTYSITQRGKEVIQLANSMASLGKMID